MKNYTVTRTHKDTKPPRLVLWIAVSMTLTMIAMKLSGITQISWFVVLAPVLAVGFISLIFFIALVLIIISVILYDNRMI